ncbi:MAG TPA: protein kinase [Thermoanaerobaculia bacterium]|nr:protein kinase [Thermoanaerobaculia bacterium]
MEDPYHRFQEVDDLLRRALDQPASERSSFLAEACRGDAELRLAVERLLEASDDNSFLDRAADESAACQRAPAASLGPYRLDSLLGRGGAARVFRAHDARLGRDVALKVVSESDVGRSQVERLQTEARSASSLNHPNVVTVYDIGSDQGAAYIAMELIEGRSLAEHVAEGPLPLDQAVDLAAQVARGLAAAHARGILHRDLKPGNIMISDDGLAKIVDFGLAKSLAPLEAETVAKTVARPVTATGAILGTVAYMSPEQAAGRPLDSRSDQFSLGTILYELSTGIRPFARPSAVETLAAIVSDEIPPPNELSPALPLRLTRLVGRCLEKDPAKRFESTEELASELAAIAAELAGSPEAGPAAPPPAARRRPLLRIVAAVAAVATAGGLLWGLRDRVSEAVSAAPAAPPVTASDPAERPAIAVLPLENLGSDPEDRYFSDGVSEDLVDRLSSWRMFPVISHFSSFAYDSRSSDLRAVGRRLGARYLVQGSVRRADGRVRIAARLVDSETGSVLWSDRFDRPYADLLALQDEIGETIVGALHPRLEEADQIRAARADPADLRAWDWSQRGWWHWNRLTQRDTELAREAFSKALELAPGFGEAHAGLALTHYVDLALGWADSEGQAMDVLEEAARRAVSLDRESAVAHHALGHALALRGRRQEMIAAFHRSIELNPMSALVLSCAGEGMALGGEAEEAIVYLERAIRLSPQDPALHIILHGVALAHFAAQRYDQSLAWAFRALELDPTFAWAHRTRAASLALLGRLDEAGTALAEATALDPGSSLAGGGRGLAAADPAVATRYLEGLRAAGSRSGVAGG